MIISSNWENNIFLPIAAREIDHVSVLLFFFTLDYQDKFLEILDCSFYTVYFVKLRKIMEMFKQILLPFFGIFALTVLVCAQDHSGFISLDCGLPRDESYTEATTKINYTSDANYIETGSGKSILPEYKVGKQQQMWFIRSFPEGIRNCYRLNLTSGDKYLIRAYFMYGNYDDANKVPSFDVYIGPNFWKTLNFNNASTVKIPEIIHVLQSDYLHFCLVNTGKGTPFISALELRLLKNTTYITQSGSLELDTRVDIGSTLTPNQIYRYKDDVYDRIWLPYNFVNTTQLTASGIIDANSNNGYEPARIVMNTAATPADADQPLDFTLIPSDSSTQYYIYMHFAEVEKLQANQSRAFNISLNGQHWYGPFSPSYLSTTTVFTSVGLNAGLQNNFSIYKTESSTLPPILNAVEIYRLKEFLQLQTEEQDFDAITNIKATYGLMKNWQGDPCVPRTFLWDGLSCSDSGSDQPRITSLNLSSSGLSGGIADYLSNLTMLESLDLSNNNLSGPVPEFLSQLLSLKVLNLERNKLSGLIPAALLDRQNNDSLSLSFDGNPGLCSSNPCKKKKNSRVVIAVVASVIAFVVILAALIALWVLKRRKQQVKMYPKSSKMYESSEQNKQQFTYSNVLKMTNNFERVIGKGGFGTVYYGRLDDTEVAVKMLSQSSAQGFKQFQSEVKLLMRVHHKDLTTLIGFCEEGTNLALIYEYMVNGNLGEHLLDNDKDILNWEMRLQMAVEAAQGLEYLHRGCKPPIIHRDVKSTNILLNDKFQAKLADFGLSRTYTVEGDTHVSTVVAGTPGYLDPEYYRSNRLTEKSDVYSFGVVLLELITGKPIILKSLDNSNSHISQWVSFNLAKGDIRSTVDPRMKGDFNINSVWKAVEIAMACVSQTSSRRPTMNHVLMELNECLATETARRKENANEFETGDSVEMMTVNLDNDVSPLAR